MHSTHDVVIIGGAFAGAATALLLKREKPELRIAIVERAVEFDRKVGEATTEVSGSFLTKRLGLANHLNNHHIAKQGLRFWFSGPDATDFGDCGELGSYYQARLPAYQVDRAVLDQHVLDLAVEAGATLLRPAKVSSIALSETGAMHTLTVENAEGKHTLTTPRIVDASGRAAVLARKLGTLRPLPEHPTNSIWARFRGVKDLDGDELRRRYPDYARAVQTSRTAATNHLTGYGWWCWIIPLKGGDTSVGLVYDERLYTPPADGKLIERLQAHLMAHPVGRELLQGATPVAGDCKAYSALPYYSTQLAGPGWQMVGDAASFMDPLYSQGLDYCSWTVSSAVQRIVAECDGKTVDVADINTRFSRSYHAWFQALYKDKYYYLGDAELMRAAFLLDIGLWFFGPVREICKCPQGGFQRFPFDGPVDGLVSKLMALYNRRLAKLGAARQEAGTYGAENRRRTIIPGFEPTPRVLRVVRKGLACWLRAECKAIWPRKKSKPMPLVAQVPILAS